MQQHNINLESCSNLEKKIERKNIELARQWYERALKLGNTNAELALKRMKGLVSVGVEVSPPWQLKFTAKITHGWGEDAPLRALGSKAESGDKEALDILRKRAEAGCGLSQYGLSQIYHYGQGIAKNPELARHWCELAAKQGVPEAEVTLKKMGSS